jgi:hypothetical protein
MNLPHREDRRDASIKEMSEAGISNYEFFNSTHWRDIPQEELDSLITREYRHVTKDINARYALTGCGLTHMNCVKHFIDTYGTSGENIAILLEDDFAIVNHKEFKKQIDTAINSTSDWEFIYLGGLRNPKEDKREEYLTGLDIAISVWNAHAYVIRNTPTIYERVNDLFYRGYFADRAYRKMIRDDKKNKHKYLITYPYIVTQRRNYSDINNCVR